MATYVWFIIINYLSYGPLQVNILLHTVTNLLLYLHLQYVTNWLTIVMAERESEGIDFWWLDWQQGGIVSVKNMICMTWDGGLRAKHNVAISCCK